MATENLNEAIAELRQEIGMLPAGSAERSRLETLLNRLEDELEDNRAVSQEIPGLIERFEVEHPTLTEALNRIMVSLGAMGI